eukprot:scaffold97753_cov32-Prasinocladus_malaysianus.AAC.1
MAMLKKPENDIAYQIQDASPALADLHHLSWARQDVINAASQASTSAPAASATDTAIPYVMVVLTKHVLTCYDPLATVSSMAWKIATLRNFHVLNHPTGVVVLGGRVHGARRERSPAEPDEDGAEGTSGFDPCPAGHRP